MSARNAARSLLQGEGESPGVLPFVPKNFLLPPRPIQAPTPEGKLRLLVLNRIGVEAFTGGETEVRLAELGKRRRMSEYAAET